MRAVSPGGPPLGEALSRREKPSQKQPHILGKASHPAGGPVLTCSHAPPRTKDKSFQDKSLASLALQSLCAPSARPPLLSQVILTPPEAQNPKSEELNVEPGSGRPLPPEVKVDGPKEELEAAVGGEAGFVQEAAKAVPEVPPAEGVPARLPAVVMETAAPVGGLPASTASSTEIAQPQKGRKPRDLELPLSPSLLGGPGPERTPGSGTGSGLQAPGPALTPSLLPTHTLVSACEGVGRAREELDCKGQCSHLWVSGRVEPPSAID